MPFVTVEVIGDVATPSPVLAQSLADACSAAFPPEHREVWVRIRRVSSENWAITGGKGHPPYPVFVSVVREVNPQGEDLLREVEGITQAVARVVGRPRETICVEFEPSARGRLAFGGRLVP